MIKLLFGFKLLKYWHFIAFCLMVFAIFGGIASCKKENVNPKSNDLTKPIIEVISKNAPTVSEVLCNATFNNVLKLNTGTELQLKIRFKGANKLAQYKIDVHNNFDCHTHGKIAITNPWKVLKIAGLSSLEAEVLESLTIPADASAGNYHFTIRLIDELGNESEPLEFNIILLNPSDVIPPVISLSIPELDSVTIARGEVLRLSGIVSDQESLNGGKVQISYVDSSGTQFDIQEFVFSSSQGKSYDLNFNYTIPIYAVKGKSVFTIYAFDEVNNMRLKRLLVTIV